MKQIVITLLSDLCAGNGEGQGNRIDTDICTDSFGIPLFPGRRLKGCLRQSACLLCGNGYTLPSGKAVDESLIDQLFGTPEIQGELILSDALPKDYESMMETLKEIKPCPPQEKIASLFSRVRGQTKLENGVAADNTLRYTRVFNEYNSVTAKQASFYADADLSSDDTDLWNLLEACCKATRHIGMHRNRGFGNVLCCLREKAAKAVLLSLDNFSQNSGTVTLEYTIVLDSQLVLQAKGTLPTSVPGRSVIGCMAEAWLKNHSADSTFDKLFQDGTVCWSDLTPFISGKRSVPAPAYAIKMKYTGEIRNACHLSDQEKQLKKSSLSEYYMVVDGNTAQVAAPATASSYHHRHESSKREAQLYSQEALEKEVLYAGTVTFPAELSGSIHDLLCQAHFHIGHSRNAQYAACTVRSIRMVENPEDSSLNSDGKNTVIGVSLASGLVLCKDGLYTCEPEDVRRMIADKLGISVDCPEGYDDSCQYGSLGGFQSMWGLWKPAIPSVSAGSVYYFMSEGKKLPRQFRIGEYQTEGKGICNVETVKQMPDLISRGKVDKVKITLKKQNHTITSMLLLNDAQEAIRETVTGVLCSDSKEKTLLNNAKANGFLSRLRVIIQECESLDKIKEKIDSIPVKDNPQNKNKQEYGYSFISMLYGNDPANKKSVIRKMLAAKPEIAEKVLADQQVTDAVMAMWKRPAMTLIHEFYYGKQEASKGGEPV